jgi:hypothetical protein
MHESLGAAPFGDQDGPLTERSIAPASGRDGPVRVSDERWRRPAYIVFSILIAIIVAVVVVGVVAASVIPST